MSFMHYAKKTISIIIFIALSSILSTAWAVQAPKEDQQMKKLQEVVYNSAGIYGPASGMETVKGNVTVAASGIKLQNTIIEGNLILSESMQEGEVILDKVTVRGTTSIQSGGQIQMTGHYNTIAIKASNLRLKVPRGSIHQLNVELAATNSEITLGSDASIMQLNLNAVTKLLGQGNIDLAIISAGARESSFQSRPILMQGAGASNQPTPCSDSSQDACKAASLQGITVSGLTLNQLDSNRYTTGEINYNPIVYQYNVVTPRNLTITPTLTITKSKDASIKYFVGTMANTYIQSGSVTNDHNTFEVPIPPMSNYHIALEVSDREGSNLKVYYIYFQHPKTIQEGLKFESKFHKVGKPGGPYTQGTSYVLKTGMINGELIRPTDSILFFRENEKVPFLRCVDSQGCSLFENNITTREGVWNVEIYRDNQLLASGQYHYNFNPAKVFKNDIDFTAVAYSKQELLDQLKTNPNYTTPFSYGYHVSLDSEKLRLIMPKAKYYVEGEIEMDLPTSTFLRGLAVDEFKLGITPGDGYPTTSLSDPRTIDYIEQGRQTLEDTLHFKSDHELEIRQINDRFIVLGVYDINFNLLGQYMTILQFDQDHVADGYAALGNWKP